MSENKIYNNNIMYRFNSLPLLCLSIFFIFIYTKYDDIKFILGSNPTTTVSRIVSNVRNIFMKHWKSTLSQHQKRIQTELFIYFVNIFICIIYFQIFI